MTRVRAAMLKSSSELLIVLATLALVVFYYMVRADSIGAFSATRGWVAVTGSPLKPVLHFVGAGLVLGAAPVLIARGLFGFRLLGGPLSWRASVRT